MSNETDENQSHINSSDNSENLLNNNLNELPKSRLSSASKKHSEQQDELNNHQTNERQIKSPLTSHEDFHQINNNQSPKHSLDNEEQPSFNDHSNSSYYVDKPINDGPMETNRHLLSSQNEQDQLNSLHLSTNHDNTNLSQGQTSNLSHHNNKQNPLSTDHDDKILQESKPIDHPSCRFRADKKWLDLQYHSEDSIKKPNELENEMQDPPEQIDEKLLDRIQGSIIGMALGDALGARVEFRPHQYLVEFPVTTMEGGGTWGLEPGQFTDDTSMAICLANSLLARQDFLPYDQLVRYKWWSKSGYMSSTGKCFDIGAATSQSIHEFERRQKEFANNNNIPFKEMDKLSDRHLLEEFDVYCSEDEVAGNGALMRLAPVPLFFFRNRYVAIEFSGRSGEITHGDKKAYDACRFYGALIVAALRGFTKEQILASNFYSENKRWFGEEPLHKDIEAIAKGSYRRKRNYEGGIRGKGYIVDALEAALWAFWSDGNSFEKGALAAVNLGDDTDTTAAIYGQLAGAYYGYKELPPDWLKCVYAHEFMIKLSKWIAYEGEQWERKRDNSFTNE